MLTNSTTLRVSIGLGVAAGAALTVYAANRKRRNRSLLARARKQASMLINRRVARLLTDSAVAWIAKGREEAARQRKGVLHAVEAGKTAYQRAAG
jgi:hypothetical protein